MVYTETSTLELKEKVTNFNDVAKTVCGFANAEGGKIIIGVNSKGVVVGIPSKEIESIQQRLDGAIQTVSSAPFHKIQVKEENGKQIVIVEVYKIGEGAFCTYGGIVYYRFGSTLRKLEGKTLQDFLIHRKILSFDESISEAKIDDLDDSTIAIYLKDRTPELKYAPKKKIVFLTNLGVIKKNDTILVKNTAVLLFASDQQKFIPQNEIKMARFRGVEAIDIIDSKFVNKTLMENLKEALDFVRKNTQMRFEIKEIRRKEIPEYPDEVVREALVNSIVHRDYFSKDAIQLNIFDDRLEIISPGGLPQGLSMKLLGTLSIQRNPLIYRLLRDIKLVEGMATGIPRMRQGMLKNNLPMPVFEDLGNFFKVTLYNSKHAEMGFLNQRQQKAVNYLKENKIINSKIYVKITSVSRVTAVSDLNDLTKKGIIQKFGKTRSAYYAFSREL